MAGAADRLCAGLIDRSILVAAAGSLGSLVLRQLAGWPAGRAPPDRLSNDDDYLAAVRNYVTFRPAQPAARRNYLRARPASDVYAAGLTLAVARRPQLALASATANQIANNNTSPKLMIREPAAHYPPN